MIAIGIGCRRGARKDDVLALIDHSIALLPPPHRGDATSPGKTGLFTHADKHDEAGLHEAAAVLGLPLVFLDPAVLTLVAGGARSCSRRVEEMFGLPGIAETAALAGAGAGAVLLVEKRSSPTVTCAIAGPSPFLSSPVQRGRGTAEGGGGGSRRTDADTKDVRSRPSDVTRQPPPPRSAWSPSPAARRRMPR